ncbi:MAG: sulfatase-like hydrolase/transferase [Treponema sp.]|nr:sulfatase-like hydrolase/transferase [Treponema sp.]
MKKPNIIVFFSDQQRFDTLGCNGQKLDITPNLNVLANEGINFSHAYTVQPVCGPARALLQTGLYPTEAGCFRNGISLPTNIATLAGRMCGAGYRTAYVGKWHLASDSDGPNYQTTAVPVERRGGYNDYWMASDILEFTSHGYGGYLHDGNGNKVEFSGYRADCVTDYALLYLDQRSAKEERPFFLFHSLIEPHHQNDHNCFEGPEGSREKFKNFIPPSDLNPGEGDWEEQMPDYLGCCHSLDKNLGRVVKKLKERGLYDDTIIIYASDHGCHFRTRINDCTPGGYDDYKRNCFENTIHIPLIIRGPGFMGGKTADRLVSLLDLPKTIVTAAGADSMGMRGEPLQDVFTAPEWKREVYIQISESYVGRALRTEQYTYCVYAPDKNPNTDSSAKEYTERYLFDNKKDPDQKNNLIHMANYNKIKARLRKCLITLAREAGEGEISIKAGE